MIHCKNCETQFKGKFCPNCGQSVYEFDRPFKFLIVDFAGNIFAFDTRFWKSLVSLILRPGNYTANYVKGHRASYTPPFRLYIFTSFIFFLLLSIYVKQNVAINENDQLEMFSAINEQLNNNKTKPDSIQIQNVKLMPNYKKMAETAKEVVNNPSTYLNRYIKFISWALFLLMQVYACFLWLFFRKSRAYYFNHLIFAINQHTYVFLLGIVILVAGLVAPTRTYYPEYFLIMAIPIYMYLGYLHYYKKGYFSTLFRLFIMAFFYTITLVIALGSILILWVNNEFL